MAWCCRHACIRAAAFRSPPLLPSCRQIACLVDAVILLRCLLRALPALSESLAWVTTPLLQAVRGRDEHRAGQRGGNQHRPPLGPAAHTRRSPPLPPTHVGPPRPQRCLNRTLHQVRNNLVRPELQELLQQVEGALEEEAQVWGH